MISTKHETLNIHQNMESSKFLCVFSLSFTSMRLTWLFLTVLVVTWLALANGKEQVSVVPYAINAIIEKHFAAPNANWQGKVNIHWFGKETSEVTAIIDKLLKIKSSTTSIKVTQENFSHEQKKIDLGESSIVFFDSMQTFKENALKVEWVSNPRQRTHHLISVPGLTEPDVIETFPDGFFIDNVNFLMNEIKNSVDLVASFMFTEDGPEYDTEYKTDDVTEDYTEDGDSRCRKLQLKTINRFNMNVSKWENSIFYPKKYENFYDCNLNVAWMYASPIEAQLLNKIFKDILKADVVPVINYSAFNCNNCDLTIQQCPLSRNYTSDGLTVSDPHIFTLFTYAVPPGEPYTDLERMFMMFDTETWIAIAITLAIGILVTLSLHFVSEKVRKFIAGRDIQSPTTNLVSIFLTGGVVRTPGRNFARFILTLFIVWSLIIRTCHQSLLFELLQADLRKPPMKTLDEMFEGNLTMYTSVGSITFDEYFEKRMAMPSTR